jgi:hypothetical protein
MNKEYYSPNGINNKWKNGEAGAQEDNKLY